MALPPMAPSLHSILLVLLGRAPSTNTVSSHIHAVSNVDPDILGVQPFLYELSST